MKRFCTNCGAELDEEQDICLKCGRKVTAEYNTTDKARNNTNNKMSMMGFIFGIVSLLCNVFGIIGLLALIFSIIGLCQISKTNESGKGFAIAGLILGIFSLIFGIIAVINLFLVL